MLRVALQIISSDTKMKITKESTVMIVDKKRNSLRTNIPALVRDVMELKAGDKIQWIMTNNEIKLRKK